MLVSESGQAGFELFGGFWWKSLASLGKQFASGRTSRAGRQGGTQPHCPPNFLVVLLGIPVCAGSFLSIRCELTAKFSACVLGVSVVLGAASPGLGWSGSQVRQGQGAGVGSGQAGAGGSSGSTH